MSTRTQLMLNSHSVEDFLKCYFDSISSRNSKYSQQAFANQIGVAKSHINDVFNNKRSVSLSLLLKVCRNLPLNDLETEHLCDLFLKAHIENVHRGNLSKSANFRNHILKQLDYLTIDEEFIYINSGRSERRVLTFFKNNQGMRSPVFCDSITATKLIKSGVSYLLPNPDGTYTSYAISSSNLKLTSPYIQEETNTSISVSFDEHQFPTIKNAVLTVPGENEKRIATIQYTKDFGQVSGKKTSNGSATDFNYKYERVFERHTN